MNNNAFYKAVLDLSRGLNPFWFIEPTMFLIDLLWFSQKYSADPPGFTTKIKPCYKVKIYQSINQ